jgi:hypothetical protein
LGGDCWPRITGKILLAHSLGKKNRETSSPFFLREVRWPRRTGRLLAHSFLQESGWPRRTGRLPAHFFTGRRLAKNKRKNSRPFFYGKAVSQEEQGDFQPILLTENRWPPRIGRIPALSFYGKAVSQEEQGDFQPIL